MTGFRLTGGCQCGAVRYEVTAAPSQPHICHCRMCQKAFGNFFADLALVPEGGFHLTRGALSRFQSSAQVDRCFCRDCGTPLALDARDEGKFYIAIATLDDYAALAPQAQYGIESRKPVLARYFETPAYATGAEADGGLEMSGLLPVIARSNRQHPDHDTGEWPPTS